MQLPSTGTYTLVLSSNASGPFVFSFRDVASALARPLGELTYGIVDAGLGAFSRGEPMAPEAMRDSVG